MKSRFEADDMYSNNYLKMHGYAMARWHGHRKDFTIRELLNFPFKDSKILRKGRRVKYTTR